MNHGQHASALRIVSCAQRNPLAWRFTVASHVAIAPAPQLVALPFAEPRGTHSLNPTPPRRITRLHAPGLWGPPPLQTPQRGCRASRSGSRGWPAQTRCAPAGRSRPPRSQTRCFHPLPSHLPPALPGLLSSTWGSPTGRRPGQSGARRPSLCLQQVGQIIMYFSHGGRARPARSGDACRPQATPQGAGEGWLATEGRFGAGASAEPFCAYICPIAHGCSSAAPRACL